MNRYLEDAKRIVAHMYGDLAPETYPTHVLAIASVLRLPFDIDRDIALASTVDDLRDEMQRSQCQRSMIRRWRLQKASTSGAFGRSRDELGP